MTTLRRTFTLEQVNELSEYLEMVWPDDDFTFYLYVWFSGEGITLTPGPFVPKTRQISVSPPIGGEVLRLDGYVYCGAVEACESAERERVKKVAWALRKECRKECVPIAAKKVATALIERAKGGATCV